MARGTHTRLRIPEELVRIVIEQTEDVETQQNWCVATSCHSDLYKFALQKRWTRTIINHEDLVASPDEVRSSMEQGSHYPYTQTRTLGQRQSRNNLANGTGLINLATKALQVGPIPATQIINLVLDFRFDDNAERPESESGGDSNGLPGDTLEHSLALLLPHLEKVEAITVDCKMPQELLNAITGYTGGHLKALKIRISPTAAYFYSPGRKGLCHQYLLNWEGLLRMKLLEVLEVRELVFGEGRGLALAVRELPSLKRLFIKTDDQCRGNPSPLQGFFDQIFPTNNEIENLSKTCGLSEKLESLVLIDSFYKGYNVHWTSSRALC